MERVGVREEKMEGHCSTGRSPQWAVVPMEEEEVLHCIHISDHNLTTVVSFTLINSTAASMFNYVYSSFTTSITTPNGA